MSAVKVSREGPLALVETDFRGKLNLLDGEAIDALGPAVRGLEGSGGLRVVVLSAVAGKAFAGGVDLAAMRDLAPGAARAFILRLAGALGAIRKLAVPVVAAIEGYALGGGLELAMACDLRAAAADAKFGMPEVKVGVPSVIEAAMLPHLVGRGRAQHLLYTGEMIGAEEAQRIGLVEKLASPGGALGVAREIAGEIAACGPSAVRAQKRLLRHWENTHIEAAIAAGADEFDKAFETGDPREGMTAFLEHRSPRYTD